MSYYVKRDVEGGQEYFAGVEDGYIQMAPWFIGAAILPDIDAANDCVAFLTENDLTGFYTSEILAMGSSEDEGEGLVH